MELEPSKNSLTDRKTKSLFGIVSVFMFVHAGCALELNVQDGDGAADHNYGLATLTNQ